MGQAKEIMWSSVSGFFTLLRKQLFIMIPHVQWDVPLMVCASLIILWTEKKKMKFSCKSLWIMSLHLRQVRKIKCNRQTSIFHRSQSPQQICNNSEDWTKKKSITHAVSFVAVKNYVYLWCDGDYLISVHLTPTQSFYPPARR